MSTKIGFIGGGNMARSLIGGMVSQAQYKSGNAADIFVHDPSIEKLAQLQNNFGFTGCESNQIVLDSCDAVVLAVKPQVMKGVLAPLQFPGNQLVISIAAGIRSSSLLQWIGNANAALIRTMPNTPALVQLAATGMFATAAVSATQKQLAEQLLQAVGITVWLTDENQLDAVTALSGSGPAYFFYVMEAMQKAGMDLGLDSEAARELTLQTALGAATLAMKSNDDLTTLRQKVTSPGGTTEQAIKTFNDAKLHDIFGKAMQAAYDRSQSLADELDT